MMADLQFDMAEGAIKANKVRQWREPPTFPESFQTFVSYIPYVMLMWIGLSSSDAHPSRKLAQYILYKRLYFQINLVYMFRIYLI